MQNKLLLQLKDVEHVNKHGLQLQKINLKIHERDVISLVGSNNQGKDILAKIIIHDLFPTAGFVKYGFDDKEIYKYLGYQFRHNTWPNGFKTKDVLDLYKIMNNITDDEWLNQLIELLQINTFMNRELSSCSYVKLESFSLFLALIKKPKILLIDTLSSAHDIVEKTNIINFLRNYSIENNASIIFINSDEQLVSEICNRIITIDHSTIIDDFKIKPDFNFHEYHFKIYRQLNDPKYLNKREDINNDILNEFNNFEDSFKESELHFLNLLIKNKNTEIQINFKNLIFHKEQLKLLIKNLITSQINNKEIKRIKEEVKRINHYDKNVWKLVKHNSNLLLPYNELHVNYLEFLRNTFKKHLKRNTLIINGNKIKILNKDKSKEFKQMKKRIIKEELLKFKNY
ncbi:ATP-binding cassette domain-containing protein [Spiroplasma culicicola]|uniref:ABC transporter ATP-binding protein n=1 Tax=Spiroplasma culicicola AES-1 TaxID=1276246 RepID=W6A6D5_9MOLU|nr:ATP-binding cassette domain-containing protein [Spiroplasma culicicola]AHI52516.1 ABC transporter ATP-binding protein [Spiroplasma culicicola AES-1]